MKYKRIFIVLMMFIVLIPFQSAYAATIMHWTYYNAALDQYRSDFTYPTGTTSYNVHFVGTGAPYDLDFNVPPTGIFYFTCNGTYSLNFFDASGSKIGYFDSIVTTAIVNPTCSSYSGQNGLDDLHLQNTPNGNGTYTLKWDAPPSGGSSTVYKDGKQVGTGTFYTGDKGSYTVVNRDASGNVVGRSDKYVPSYDGTGGTGGTGEKEDITLQECADQICTCIQELKPILNQISTNTKGILDKMPAVITAINEVRDQLVPTADYPVKTVNDYAPLKLEDNKPLLHESGSFQDNKVYFQDQGDAQKPSKLPAVPDPVTEWKNGTDKVQKEPLNVREQPMQKTPAMKRDPVKTRDPVLTRDTTVYPLRWESSQYP